jgi:uncharacterized Zn finger protein
VTAPAEWVGAIGLDASQPAARRRLREAERLSRAGRVISMRAMAGRVEGRVQGSHARPHLVELGVAVWTDDQWHRVTALLATQARHYARLLAGQLPEQFDAALRSLGLSLIPEPAAWRLQCTCRHAAPCVHQAAVWLDVRDRLDDDPYLIARLRGRSREQLLAEIRDRRSDLNEARIPLEGLDPQRWSRARVPPADVPLPPVRTPATTAGPLRVLGDPPGWPGPVDAVTMFGPAIAAAGVRAASLLSDDPLA